MLWSCIRPSVCPSQVGVLPKRLTENIRDQLVPVMCDIVCLVISAVMCPRRFYAENEDYGYEYKEEEEEDDNDKAVYGYIDNDDGNGIRCFRYYYYYFLKPTSTKPQA